MYLDTGIKSECFGCEACKQVCPKNAISMDEDQEGFRYPHIDENLCIHCGLCRKACPHQTPPPKYKDNKYVVGGFNKNGQVRFNSTSGGAFSAIVDAYCDDNYAIFGAQAKGLLVFHSYIQDKRQLGRFRKSKYSQSIIGTAYRQAMKFLREGKKVVFSGTPCQIAGLYSYFTAKRFTETHRLLTVEVVCEGVPSPLYVRKLDQHFIHKYGAGIKNIDYRYTGKSLFGNGKWDFQMMKSEISGGGYPGKWDFEIMRVKLMNNKVYKIDRWFNPFWSIWLNHLMSRPSCYECPFAEQGRTADITLGDLWGVHLYCPELYGKNGGSSLVVGNTEKGAAVIRDAEKYMIGHELRFEDALKYQSPMRKHIDMNPNRDKFMSDLRSDMTYTDLNRKWAKRPSIKLLWQKYIWGNRQKIAMWNLTQKLKNRG